ncbi:MAG TPA: PIN domain-containing protein [Rhizobiaceae bacterium]|nr:PIN domain-containing protein [Rhizobiaceae bacterium]
MPDVRFFIDTNVLLYSYDRGDEARRKQAQMWLSRLVGQRAATINLQVVNEVTEVLLRRKWFDTPAEVFVIADAFANLGSTPIGRPETEGARKIRLRYSYSWWDCLLLASAIELGCTHFLSEDLQDGQIIEGLTIVSPFAHTPEQILLSR